jgi:hypothetical protein
VSHETIIVNVQNDCPGGFKRLFCCQFHSVDETRVKLIPFDDEDGSDYINASYVSVNLLIMRIVM